MSTPNDPRGSASGPAGPGRWAPDTARPPDHGWPAPPHVRYGPPPPPTAPTPPGGRHRVADGPALNTRPAPEAPKPSARSPGGLFGGRRRREEAEAEKAALADRVAALEAELA